MRPGANRRGLLRGRAARWLARFSIRYSIRWPTRRPVFRPAGARTLLLLLLIALPQPLLAGAWARGKGHHFSAGAYRLNLDLQGNSTPAYTYYHEFGLTDDWTLGLDLGGAISGFDKAVIFASRAYQPIHGIHVATDLGFGRIAGADVIRPGFAIGRSLARPQGWLSLEGATEFFPDTLATDWKIDATWGFAPGERTKYYMQLQTGQHHGDGPFARLAGSAAWRLRDGLYLDLGAAIKLKNSDPLRLKFGFWWER